MFCRDWFTDISVYYHVHIRKLFVIHRGNIESLEVAGTVIPGGCTFQSLIGDVLSRLQKHTCSIYQFFEKVYPTSLKFLEKLNPTLIFHTKMLKIGTVPHTKIVKINTVLYTNIWKIDILSVCTSLYLRYM